jgi:ABC-type transporter Mla maintaining outer membrane lipid asymmetry ATPase subunit MlaF
VTATGSPTIIPPQTLDLAVIARGLTKRFGERTVVDQLNLAIPAGSVSGFVRPDVTA